MEIRPNKIGEISISQNESKINKEHEQVFQLTEQAQNKNKDMGVKLEHSEVAKDEFESIASNEKHIKLYKNEVEEMIQRKEASAKMEMRDAVKFLADLCVPIPGVPVSQQIDVIKTGLHAMADAKGIAPQIATSIINSSLTAEVLSAAMGFDGSEEIDLRDNHGEVSVFKDIKTDNYNFDGVYELCDNPHIKNILSEIDKLELSDEQKVALLEDAAGSKGPGKMTAKELICAYMNGMDQVAEAEKKSPQIKSGTTYGDDDKCNCDIDSDMDLDNDVDNDLDSDLDNDTGVIK